MCYNHQNMVLIDLRENVHFAIGWTASEAYLSPFSSLPEQSHRSSTLRIAIITSRRVNTACTPAPSEVSGYDFNTGECPHSSPFQMNRQSRTLCLFVLSVNTDIIKNVPWMTVALVFVENDRGCIERRDEERPNQDLRGIDRIIASYIPCQANDVP